MKLFNPSISGHPKGFSRLDIEQGSSKDQSRRNLGLVSFGSLASGPNLYLWSKGVSFPEKAQLKRARHPYAQKRPAFRHVCFDRKLSSRGMMKQHTRVVPSTFKLLHEFKVWHMLWEVGLQVPISVIPRESHSDC